MIDSFQGDHRFLSNFYPARIVLDGMLFTSVEAAYVAGKTLDRSTRLRIQSLETPGKVKRFGRSIPLRPDWEEVKIPLMLSLLRQKFKEDSVLGDLLWLTGKHELIEGNTWGDTFWGVCNGVGHNHLGKLLMQIRQEMAQEG